MPGFLLGGYKHSLHNGDGVAGGRIGPVVVLSGPFRYVVLLRLADAEAFADRFDEAFEVELGVVVGALFPIALDPVEILL